MKAATPKRRRIRNPRPSTLDALRALATLRAFFHGEFGEVTAALDRIDGYIVNDGSPSPAPMERSKRG